MDASEAGGVAECAPVKDAPTTASVEEATPPDTTVPAAVVDGAPVAAADVAPSATADESSQAAGSAPAVDPAAVAAYHQLLLRCVKLQEGDGGSAWKDIEYVSERC